MIREWMYRIRHFFLPKTVLKYVVVVVDSMTGKVTWSHRVDSYSDCQEYVSFWAMRRPNEVYVAKNVPLINTVGPRGVQ